MNLKKHLPLVVTGVLSLILTVVGLVLLVRHQRHLNAARQQSSAMEDRIQSLYRANPFPSAENLDAMRSSQQEVRRQVRTLQRTLAERQTPLPEIGSIHGFHTMLEGRIRNLRQLAREGGPTAAAAPVASEPEDDMDMPAVPAGQVPLAPPNYHFGFARYVAEGRLARQRDLSRLVRQVVAADTLVRTVFDAAAERPGRLGLVQIQRTVFEPEATETPDMSDDPFGAMGAGIDAPPGEAYTYDTELYYRERFLLQLSADEAMLIDLLNRLARQNDFIIVNRVQFTNPASLQLAALTAPARAPERAPPRTARPATRPPGEAPEPVITPLPRHQRVIAGRNERLVVEIEVDVIRFKQTPGADVESLAEGGVGS